MASPGNRHCASCFGALSSVTATAAVAHCSAQANKSPDSIDAGEPIN